MKWLNNKQVMLKIRGFLLVALLIAGLMAWVISWGNRHASWPTHPDLAKVSQSTGVRFPKSARLLGSHLGIFTTMELSAKIEIAQSDVKSFLAQFPPSQYSETSIIQTTLEKYAPNYPWWDPESVKDPSVFVDENNRLYGSVGRAGDKHAVIYMFKLAR